MRLSLLLFFCLHGICWTKYTCVYQPKVLYVKEGESVTIPCSYTYPDYYRRKSQIIVTWGKAEGRYCSKITKNITDPSGNIVDDEYKDRISVVNNPENRTGSITIRGLKATDGVTFCCIETIYTTTSKAFSWFDIYGTTLTFAGPPSSSAPFTVTQLYNITGHRGESVTLSCSYSPYMESDVLGVDIYWRAGNISGPYVYHPYKEMVHPNYSGRTGIIRAADLHIQGLEMSDASTYYCFVLIRLCRETVDHQKIIQYGGGTRLIIKGYLPPG